MNRNQFFEILFEPKEATCFAKDMYGVQVFSVARALNWGWPCLFSINPLHPTQDLSGKACEGKGWRNDQNVTAFRNILVEYDSIPLEEQRKRIAELGLPFTTAVYSGSKSIHFIISLAKSLETREAYDQLVRRIHSAIPGIDSKTKNPSRLSRLPGAVRPETGESQQLVEIRNSVELSRLEAWLSLRKVPEKLPSPPSQITIGKKRLLKELTLKYLHFGHRTQESSRNQSLFNAACDMKACGYAQEEAEHRLTPIAEATGLSIREILTTISSAFSRERN